MQADAKTKQVIFHQFYWAGHWARERFPPSKSFAEIRSKHSALPKVKLFHHKLETQLLVCCIQILMPAWAVLGDHTDKTTLILEVASYRSRWLCWVQSQVAWLSSLCICKALWGLGGWRTINCSIFNNKSCSARNLHCRRERSSEKQSTMGWISWKVVKRWMRGGRGGKEELNI